MTAAFSTVARAETGYYAKPVRVKLERKKENHVPCDATHVAHEARGKNCASYIKPDGKPKYHTPPKG
ncbi:hypothetical protein P5673_016834 [Acropora cervicornis]|uniref:Uncharacterized protein n=1 Tax=Acropora cervicornis TaxID=6130 RepID=A0AAD9V4K1_ACRCE|nr:hypothetical protein P5673_016834 [Acropora cervicornis]